MTAIDVGQGDSILLVSPSGRTLLVDAGGLPHWAHSDLDIGEDVVSPYLWSRAISRLDAMAITHAHADHMGGAAAILANFRPRELWLADPSDPEMTTLVQQAQELGVRVVRHQAGDEFGFGGAEVRILAPRDQDLTARRNDESLVMKLAYGKTSALLEGDAENRSEHQIAEEHPRSGFAEGGAPRQRDLHDPAAARTGASPVRCDFCGSAQYLRTSAERKFLRGWVKPTC